MSNACAAPLLRPLAAINPSNIQAGRAPLYAAFPKLVASLHSCHNICSAVRTVHHGARHRSPVSPHGSFNCYKSENWISSTFKRKFSETHAAFDRKARSRQPSSNEDIDWHRYEETKGVPLPGGAMSKADIKKYIGSDVSVELGNHILRVIQYRRLSGSLAEQGVDFPQNEKIPEEIAYNALDFLRSRYPMDEAAAAARWAEEEAARLEDKFIENATRAGISSHKHTQEEEQQQGTAYGRSRYGSSILDQIKKRREEELDRKEKEAEEQAKILEQNSGTLQAVGRKGELSVREKPAWIQYWEEKASGSQLKTPPALSNFQRLWPSALVAAGIISGCFFLAEIYTPPTTSARLWPDTPPSAATHIALVATNALIFLLWRVPFAWPTLNRYFVQVPGYPTALSVIGNVFSHQKFKHLLFNMLVLLAVGPPLHEHVGRGNFLAIYLASGALGSFSSLAWYVLRGNLATASFGASGAVCGIVAARCLIVPSSHLAVPFYPDFQIPITSAMLLALLVGGEFVGMYTTRHRPQVDYLAHLGGYAAGIAASVGLRRQLEERRRFARQKLAEKKFITQTFGNDTK